MQLNNIQLNNIRTQKNAGTYGLDFKLNEIGFQGKNENSNTN